MFFILSKILYFLILPFSWVIVGFLWTFFSKNPKLNRRLIRLSIITLLIFSNTFFANLTLRVLEADAVVLKKNYELGIVLSGIVHHGIKIENQAHFGEGVDRLIEAVRLYRSGVINKILITGGAADPANPTENEGKLLVETAIMLGVNDNDLILEGKARNTYENAKFSQPIVSQFSSAVLITSAFHMPRAKACFAKQGLEVIAYPVDFQTTGDWHLMNFIPSAYAFLKWNTLIKEIVGLIIYRLMGYI